MKNILMKPDHMTQHKDIIIRESTQEEHDNTMEIMASFFNAQDNGKVGLFWYDVTTNALFGVLAVDKDSLSEISAGGLISCKERHEQVWRKGFSKQINKLNGEGPFKGDFRDTLRGQVFYNPTTDTFEIRAGSWIDRYPEALDEIIDEFDLTGYKIEVIKDPHYDVLSERNL